jgi:DNA-binding response OmpR family regulator
METTGKKDRKKAPKTVLVVDDDPRIRRVVRHFLSEAGYSVVDAKNAKEGIAVAQHGGVDLVLMDVMMAEMNGFAACEKLRQDERTYKIPVIFLTALTDHSSKILGSLSGGVDYVTKPFKRRELLSAIKDRVGAP